MFFKFFVVVVSTTIFAQVNFAHPTTGEESLNGGGHSESIQPSNVSGSLDPAEVKPADEAQPNLEKYANRGVDAANPAIPTSSDFGASGQNLESSDVAENVKDLKLAFAELKSLPEEAYNDLKESVSRIVDEITGDNVIKSHLKNGLFVMNLYENVAEGELDLNNLQQVMAVCEENREAMNDLREEIHSTRNMVTSTLEQAPHIEATKKSIAAVSEKLNTPSDTLIEAYKRQSSMQPQRQVEANYNGFPGETRTEKEQWKAF